MNKRKLEPKFTNQKSFYGKAYYRINDNTKTLFVNDNPLISMVGNDVALFDSKLSDQEFKYTRDFLLQNGHKADSKNQVINDYKYDPNTTNG